ncbi:MAG TPA: hypothetical protein VEQ36_16315 [Thermomicrobiales bacterium]|nr:hypothetical protein [Thermomicrobiales bacterium]
MSNAQRFWRQAVEDRLPVLVIAAIVVGIAIGMDGDGRRFVNGIGGVLWLVGAFLIFTRSVASGVTWRQIGLVIVVILVLSSLIRPTDPVWAVIGFGWGGVVVGFAGRDLGSKLGAMLGALWLPAHLFIAVVRAGIRELRDQPAALRTDPPPTAVFVPLIMVLAAWLFAALAAEWRMGRADGKLLVPRSPVRSRQGPGIR